jgi:mono/diheme cytochrome c family protein
MATYLGRVRIAGFVLVASAVTVGAAAQTPAGQNPAPTVKSAVAIPIISMEGGDNFSAYCAVCHGADAKGNGPAAPAMKVPVPDLTTIALRNKGKFNSIAVQAIIKGTHKLPTPAHGIETMPIWGEVFRGSDAAATRLRIGNLVKYLESIQQPVK